MKSAWSTWLSSRFSGKTAEGASISASALFVSIFILIFAVTTQLLAATGAIWLSTTLQLTMWLVAAGLIVLLSITDMACRAYVTAKRPGKVPAGEPPVDMLGSDKPKPPMVVISGQSKQNPGAYEDNRDELHPALRNHSPIRVDTTEVFPRECWLAPDPISKEQDKVTGKPVFRCRVLDRDPEDHGSLRKTIVEILADQMTDLPTLEPYELVQFVGLTVTPDDSLRAIRIEPCTPRPAPDQEKPKAA